MTNEKRFDDRAQELANNAAQTLLSECPELGSVMIAFNWDMVPAATDALPAGVWAVRDNSITTARAHGIMQQLVKMLTHVTELMMNAMTRKAPEVPEDQGAP